MSGGRATVALRKGIDLANQAGDIVAIHPIGIRLTGRFFVECKHYADLELANFMLRRKGKLERFWQKTRKQAKERGREPFMICLQNRMPILVITYARALSIVCDHSTLATAIPLNQPRVVSPQVFMFDDVIKQRFKIPRYMLKESTDDEPLRRDDTRRFA